MTVPCLFDDLFARYLAAPAEGEPAPGDDAPGGPPDPDQLAHLAAFCRGELARRGGVHALGADGDAGAVVVLGDGARLALVPPPEAGGRAADGWSMPIVGPREAARDRPPAPAADVFAPPAEGLPPTLEALRARQAALAARAAAPGRRPRGA